MSDVSHTRFRGAVLRAAALNAVVAVAERLSDGTTECQYQPCAGHA